MHAPQKGEQPRRPLVAEEARDVEADEGTGAAAQRECLAPRATASRGFQGSANGKIGVVSAKFSAGIPKTRKTP
jgi:hypothetical protein